MAADILRQKMSNIHDTHSYISALDLDIRHCGDFVPDLLYNLSIGVSNGKTNQEVTSCTDNGHNKDNLKMISICHAIIGLSQHVRTPIDCLGTGCSYSS